MQDYNRVRTAASDFMALMTPMVVMSASNFLSMDNMVCMKEARDVGMCRVPDSHEDIANFKKKGNRIILISHQWLGFKTPDTADSLQLRAMQRFVQQMVKKFDVLNVFVWLDYISIAQRRIRQQAARVASLPVNVSQVEKICLVRARRFAQRHGRTVRTPYLQQARLLGRHVSVRWAWAPQ